MDKDSAAGVAGARDLYSEAGGYFSKNVFKRGGNDSASRICRCTLIVDDVGSRDHEDGYN